MRTITKTFEVFKLNELSKDIQEQAYNKWLENFDYTWSFDNIGTLEEFSKVFNIKVYNWEYDEHSYSYLYNFKRDEDEQLSGMRLYKFILNNFWSDLFGRRVFHLKNDYFGKTRKSKILYERKSCGLTGYCMDDDIMDPIYEFLKKPSKDFTFRDLIESCLDSFFSACKEDFRYSCSEEKFRLECEENDVEFLENGEVYN